MDYWCKNGITYNFEQLIELLEPYNTVYIGSDSKYYNSYVRYATVICVDLNPGITYWYLVRRDRNVPGDIRSRIWAEVNKSMDVAIALSESIQ